jgi:GNAT superfamily N-acetyltransferase
MKMNDLIRFCQSDFSNHQEEILALRNACRETPQDSVYLRWRYLGWNEAPEPQLFWAETAEGRKIGMAALIMRPYCCSAQLWYIPVLGDISVLEEFRGQRISTQLYQYMNQFLNERQVPFAFVIPNPPAARGLENAGWQVAGSRTPYIYLINPAPQLGKRLHSERIARWLGGLYHAALRRLKRFAPVEGDYCFLIEQKFDERMEQLWEELPRENLLIGDHSLPFLQWRYQNHPQLRFTVAKAFKKGRLVGYFIFGDCSHRVCLVYDMLVDSSHTLGQLARFLVAELVKRNDYDALQLVINGDHPYGKELERSGWVRRPSNGPYMFYRPGTAPVHALSHQIMSGDKDI